MNWRQGQHASAAGARWAIVSLGLVGGVLGVPSVAGSQPSAPNPSTAALASAEPAPASAPVAAGDFGGPSGATTAAPAGSGGGALRLKQSTPPPPPPTPAQQRALEVLQREAKDYELGAREFRNTLTMIVRHHYEAKRRRVLAALDAQVKVEDEALAAARDEAIARLEKFIARYSGPESHPTATPDAMFRLAALYEERGRADFEAELGPRLEPAVALYRRIILEYPEYEEIAAVHYYLGHALTDSGRIDEGQQVWRALVCRNRYHVLDDASDPRRVKLESLVQDHDTKFWNDWYNRNPLPLDANAIGGKRVTDVSRAAPGDELVFRDPYPADCEMQPQEIEPGTEPRYVAEAWWLLGDYHFGLLDPAGGPFSLNRAVSAYDHSLVYKKPPLYGVAMYKQAWTYFKQQRYHRAVDEFVKLLRYADEQEVLTGDPGADFRSEAFTYIAGSLAYVDFEGPPPDHPAIPRNDVLDTETDPLVAEEKMAVAIQRVQEPALIPQDAKWTVEIYKSLAQEFVEVTQSRNAIATLELTLERFPMDRDAPLMQNKVAELYEALSRLSPEGSAAREEYAGKSLAARTRLKDYVGVTAWTDANKGDPEALQQAEQLASQGLKRAAADHTNYAKNFYAKARELSDEGEQRGLLERSIAEFRLAAEAWKAYYLQDPNAIDGYESKFWLADAHFHVVLLQIVLERSPKPEEVAVANETAAAVRDSNEDDRYLQPAAYYLVTIADKVVEDQYRLYEESQGSRGIARRTELEFTGEGDSRKVVAQPLPEAVLAMVRARDEYNERIPVDRDPEQNGPLYAFQNADLFFVHGQFAEARKRYTPIYEIYCGKNEWGYQAWEKLISMSNFESNTKESRRLAEAKSCAINEDQKGKEAAIRKPVSEIAAYMDAGALFEDASKMPEGPERNQKWREAAAAYKVALEKAPGNDNAPEAAMNGAFAYKQVGEYDKAIEMYELFISKYGNDTTLRTLRDGDPKATPPKPADRSRYETRVRYLKDAYDALASSYVLFFTYPRAAETFEKIANNEHFQQDHRRESARQSLMLYASLGDPAGMRRAHDRFRSLGASPKELAEAEFIVASSDLKKWDQYSPDTGANGTARLRAMRVMDEYYAKNKNQDAAAAYVVQAAYWSAKMRKSGKSLDTNKWWQNTINAFERYRTVAPRKDGKSSALGTVEAGMAAEADYTLLDQALARDFDYETGHHRYKGTVVQVITEYKKDAVVAKQLHDKLQRIVDSYLSPEWTAIAISRQGSLYDSLRSGLYNTRPPALKLFDDATEQKLKRAEESGNPDLMEKADAVRVKVQTAWRDAREKEINAADEIMVNKYATAVVLSRRYNVTHAEITRAVRRLAFFTDVIGEAGMQAYASKVKDLNYTPGMFMNQRPGMVTAPAPDAIPRPLPALVAP
ncbi:MAG: tetratricopeptide repeat protein [Polyangiaceae bacterium]|nr:tetratricopeptide repeat protein [Polyangiaceae bacterium]